ncbi:uncharacterized protein MELLADRAFT_106568 [Melampsora larici-populina 98AG31]|uniref:F-box domain-containing protein n=1 Tax=Melampsora larici-populina (strain 98AG31 / pathotype 3-4-7) TaxID=747676 RepID=F4RLX7_MELLP|nr:uncharacterized protein MELLADRAFT_106568 [Melampsora larici-populina 98AG31]EGG06621.1 hypothetical protein MELLADRAFT_106568 [Melampsora larici-populina 98AG31]
MHKSSEQEFTAPKKLWLPFEIVSQIINEYVSKLTYSRNEDIDLASDPCLDHKSRTELLSLRLVSKLGQKAIIPFAFHTIRLRSSTAVQVILDNWSKIQAPDCPCPVKRLIIQDLIYIGPNDYMSLKKGRRRQYPIFVDQAAKLIELIGENLNELKLFFIDSFGISPSLVEAAKRITNLRKLSLLDLQCTTRDWAYDPLLLSDFFLAMPRLEALTLLKVDVIILPMNPPALSNLRYLNFGYFDSNRDAITHICQTAKDSLKIINFRGQIREPGRVFGPIVNTLEGLITRAVTVDIPESPIDMNFPKLRLLRTRLCHDPHAYGMFIRHEHFLIWPIFRTIRTLVLDSYGGPAYLASHLRYSGEDPFRNTPNLRHIIFVLTLNATKVDLRLLGQALSSHGIQCHIKPESTPEELMCSSYELIYFGQQELDLKLNGPVK